jgi:iron complex transport system ATP-binding protein
MIAADALTLRRGGRALVDGVSCRVEPGEVLAVVGANGAGKTTLLKMLTGEHTPDSGSVRINGKRIGEYAPDELARVRGYLPQHSTLEFDFTVSEVVLLGRAPHPLALASSAQADLVRQALEACAIAALGERSYTTLSGGEQQRVHLARVLVQIWQAPAQGSRVLLLDEPTSSLDLGQQHGVLESVRRFARQGTAVLMVLHDLNLAARFADRVLLLHQGRVLASGAPEEVLSADHLLTAFAVQTRLLKEPAPGVPLLVTLGRVDAHDEEKASCH